MTHIYVLLLGLHDSWL